jgi:hypothetical protein
LVGLSNFILAQGDIEISPKLIFGIIFLIIWGISAVVSWLNKQQQRARQRRIQMELEQAQRIGRMTNRPAPQPPPVRRPAPQRISEGIAQRFPDVLLPPAPPPVPQQQRQRPVPLPPPRAPQHAPRRQSKQQPPRRAVPALPPEPMVDLAPMEVSSTSVVQPVKRAKAPTVDAAAIRSWMTPNTLRQQFILTEILQPPLAMRTSPFDRN